MITQPTKLNSSAYYYPGIKVSNYTEHDLIKDVCEYFKIPCEDIKKRAKSEKIVTCRQVIAFLTRKRFPHIILKGVGALIGRDHSTVITSCRVVQNDIYASKLYSDMINEIDQIIESHIFKNNEINK